MATKTPQETSQLQPIARRKICRHERHVPHREGRRTSRPRRPGAQDTAGKILGIFFPIMAFVAIGFDHVVANMFFLPAAIFAEVPGITWGDALNNWLWAFLGNLVGAAIFVSTAYWFLYLRGNEDDAGPTNEEPKQAETTGNGRTPLASRP